MRACDVVVIATDSDVVCLPLDGVFVELRDTASHDAHNRYLLLDRVGECLSKGNL